LQPFLKTGAGFPVTGTLWGLTATRNVTPHWPLSNITFSLNVFLWSSIEIFQGILDSCKENLEPEGLKIYLQHEIGVVYSDLDGSVANFELIPSQNSLRKETFSHASKFNGSEVALLSVQQHHFQHWRFNFAAFII